MILTWKEIFSSENLRNEALAAKDVIEELESLLDKLGISQFDLDEVLCEIIAPMQEVIFRHQDEFQQKKSQLSAFLNQKVDTERQILSTMQDSQKAQRRSEEIDVLLSKYNPELVNQLREEKKSYHLLQSDLEKQAFSDQMRDFREKYAEKLALEAKSDF